MIADIHVDIELTEREPELVDLITCYRVEWDEHQHFWVLPAGADEFVRARGVVS